MFRIAGILIMIIVFAACRRVSKPVNQDTVTNRTERSTNTWDKKMADSAVGLLRDGDLVMRRGIDVSSYLLAQMNLKNKTYSHCGVVLVENGKPYVYHSIGGEDNPNARLRRDPAAFFFSPYNNLMFGIARYDMNNAERDSLAVAVHEYYNAGKMFDLDFDMRTDDRLYCAEFVYKALRHATKDSSYIKLSDYRGFRFAGIDDLYMNPHCKLVWEVKYK